MSLIIGITGLHQDAEKKRQTIGAGKDAAAARLIEKHGFVRIGIADHLKRICKAVFDFSDEQLWGPSQARNKPDRRYQRGGRHGADSMKRYQQYKELLAAAENKFAKDANEKAEQERAIADLRKQVEEWEAFAYLTPRFALQQLGTEWGRTCYDSVWIEDALRTAFKLLEQPEDLYYDEKIGLDEVQVNHRCVAGVVFSDVRFHNEFESIKKAGGKLVRVRRYSWTPFDTRGNATHQSETELLDYGDDAFDYILDNGGDLAHLGLLVDRMVDTFEGKIIPYDETQADVPPALRRGAL